MMKFLGEKTSLVVAAGALVLLGFLSLLPQGEQPLEGLAMLRLLLALTAILALIRAAVPALKKLSGGRTGTGSRMKVQEMVSMGGRHRAAVLRVDEREFLVGMGSDGMRLLADLGEQEASESEELREPFRTLLRRAQPS